MGWGWKEWSLKLIPGSRRAFRLARRPRQHLDWYVTIEPAVSSAVNGSHFAVHSVRQCVRDGFLPQVVVCRSTGPNCPGVTLDSFGSFLQWGRVQYDGGRVGRQFARFIDQEAAAISFTGSRCFSASLNGAAICLSFPDELQHMRASRRRVQHRVGWSCALFPVPSGRVARGTAP